MKCALCGSFNDSMTHVCQQCWRETPEEANELNNEIEEEITME